MPREVKYKSAKITLSATSGSAGYDLHSVVNQKIPPFESELIKTDLQIEIPEGFYGNGVGRSRIALKYNIITYTGTIDSDFGGGVCIILINLCRTEYEVDYGERIG